MVFSDLIFLYFFLPIFFVCYFLVKNRFKNFVLLFFSLIFYGWGEPKFLFLMVISVLQTYIFGILIEKYRYTKLKNVFSLISIVLSFSLLVIFKYADFIIGSINSVFSSSVPLVHLALPIGISFYTFQTASYIIDVARGETKAQRSFVNLAAYVTMFPQLIAGPIVRYSDINERLENRNHTIDGIGDGITRFVIGLSKKVLISNQLYAVCDAFKTTSEPSVLFYWLYAVAYTLHIYFDFSGYSDMAIGLGKVFGFDFLENFNYPYISKSITEFWRRWHISLGTWFKDYVYIPLGGSRCKKPRAAFNIFVVWMFTGLWHGAAWNFVLWGIFYAVLLMGEKFLYGKLLEKTKILKHVYVLLAVIIGFVLFDSPTLSDTLNSVASLFFLKGLPIVSNQAIYYLKSYALILIVSAVGSTPLLKNAVGKIKESRFIYTVKPIFICLLLVLCTAYIIDGSFNPFLYFRF